MLLATAMIALVACSDAEFRPRQVGQQHVAPTDADLLLAEARAQFRAGNFALAAGSFRRIIARVPDSVEAYNGMAASYDRLGRFDLARRYYEEGLALAPNDPGLRTNYAAALRSHGLDREADMVAAVQPPAAAAASTALAEAIVPDVTPVPVETASPPVLASTSPTAPQPAPTAVPAPAPSTPTVVARAAPTISAPAAAPIRAAAAVATIAAPQRRAEVNNVLPPLATPRALPVPRLERRSLGEVALITTRGPAPANGAAPRRGTALPVRMVRNTGREIVWELPAATPAPRLASGRGPVVAPSATPATPAAAQSGTTRAPASAPHAVVAAAGPVAARAAPRAAVAASGLVVPRAAAPVRALTPAPQRPAIVELRILNAVGRRGQAGRMERHLRTAGWQQVSAGDSTARRDRSYILARPADAPAARRLAAALPFRPRLNLSATAGPLRLVLGRDAVGFDQRLMRSVRAS